jgi:hypothetical protein
MVHFYFFFYLASRVILDGPVHGSPSSAPKYSDLDEIGTYNIYTPKSIHLRNGIYVDSIQIVYQTADGILRVAPRRGGDRGNDCRFDLDDGERIVKITGGSNRLVDSLQFFTNRGRASRRCGGTGGIAFTEQHPGYVLSYITGEAGQYLDLIQFHWIREEAKYIMLSVNYDLEHVKKTSMGSPKAMYVVELINRGPIEQSQSYTKTFTTSDSDTWTVNHEMTVREP